ncbi:glycosyltransferase family 2 protein [Roseovarius sp. A21]|uniref:Glycosyltransferase family 2 protein n=1 Tax=Roseovarius bejariae TaxID=2576383 RepID=A0A844CTI6_9RHOB|nr:glycosyltransferase family 2 protein [Roseovarius bejariae]MRU15319.1 glycosyltransferase family 2 protein [Roseovarius bejariae]
MAGQVHFREMAGTTANGITLLEAVAHNADGGQVATLYFQPGTDPKHLGFPKRAEVLSLFTIGGAPVVRLSLPRKGAFALSFAGARVEVTPAAPECRAFEGLDAAAALSNGEGADTILQWLAFNAEHQGMNAAVILDRTRPGERPEFDAALTQGVAAMDRPMQVTVLRSHHPLGKQDLPAEGHPFCAPAAPGKDRMEIPPPAPWSSPIGALHCYEIMRDRFLGEARAVANVEVHDLIVDDGEDSVFDRAVAANGGVIQLLGQTCYPWRVRNNDPIRFADHICVQFDAAKPKSRWCIAPAKAPEKAIWRLTRIGNADPDLKTPGRFYRFMNLRHPAEAVSLIVPKTALIEDDRLLELSKKTFGHKPVRVPDVSPKKVQKGRGRRAIVTTMKNEGPFILEWLAYHRAIGFDDFLIYTNDCADGTDDMFDLLQAKGYLQHRDNPFREMNLKPQHAALAAAGEEPIIKDAKWATCIDVDEFINIKVGDGTLDDLFKAVPDANMIAMTWRLFGNADIADFHDDLIIRQFTRCAPEFARKPHQAWGFKTLFQNAGIFKKLGVHRPKGLNPQLVDDICWVNGSGVPLPESMYRNGWRSTVTTYGYDLVQLNHYAVRSAESFLVKRDRGRVNHVDRDQGLAYWFRMNNNAEQDTSVQRMIPRVEAELAKFMADPEIAAMHAHCVKMHRAKIDELRATENYSNFFAELNGDRMRKLAHMHAHFGSNVFLSGPECVPDDVLARDPEEDFFFTVEKGETQH